MIMHQEMAKNANCGDNDEVIKLKIEDVILYEVFFHLKIPNILQ